MTDSNHALVFGATGLLGWAVTEQLLSGYPQPGAFSTVTAVVRRPETDLGLPSGGPAFRLVGGVDLLGSGADLTARLRDVPDVERTTHVFYYVFATCGEDEAREARVNGDMLLRVVEAVNAVAPRLVSFVFAGGTKQYGIWEPGGKMPAPLRESLVENMQPEEMPSCVYPLHRQILTDASRGKGWVWTELCPDVVVGYSPFGADYSLALHWAQYLSLVAEREGEGTRVPFPGCAEAYECD
ncbi:hypothetical protein CDD80_6044 [Ophiocordyceps camponoti-rufipedis]|uniref:PRISE-like Rossmann-fold domain-containing protein n=1 Tax=Ophiocordyceps camponoti-rufipedis TaxID=2004952 RepID=A0A2C5XX03_9HYPO|nr:hypothetical protein CDD80_6044 [Ophiocordyceps camponoti-rufipedis]